MSPSLIVLSAAADSTGCAPDRADHWPCQPVDDRFALDRPAGHARGLITTPDPSRLLSGAGTGAR